ncbi:MAG: hypothetical protein K2I69_08865 [Muribaculaceae bacterium]|nr:hypothetical protein [Muribaculaceae bacterium]
MKKALITALLLSGGLLAQAQLLEVVSTQHVKLPQGYRVEQANVSPDGTYAIVSSMSGEGLTKIDLQSGQTSLLSEKGSNYDLRFTPDSRYIVYREASTGPDHKRLVSVKSTDVLTKKTVTVAEPSREIQAIDVQGSLATAIDGGKRKARQLGNLNVEERPVLSIDHAQLCITRKGETKVLSPLGTQGKSYIWQSLSPDASKIVFVVVGEGCYTCNVDGTNVQSLGILRAPVWYDNNTIVGMVNESNGYVVTRSEIVATNVDGSVRQTLTTPDLVATYPSASTGKISFTTTEGEMYILNLK